MRPFVPWRVLGLGGFVAMSLAVLVPGDSLEAQRIRRPEPRAFRVSVAPFVGLGWAGPRAVATHEVRCPGAPCAQYRVGASPAGGVEVHVPLPGSVALGLAAAVSRPNRYLCVAGVSCELHGGVTAVHGSALALWRFKRRAPMYLGFGPAMTHLRPGPVHTQGPTTEFGGAAVAAFDTPVAEHVGIRAVWWNYFLAPTGGDLPGDASPKGIVWESRVTVGVVFLLGSPTVLRPPRTFGAAPGRPVITRRAAPPRAPARRAESRAAAPPPPRGLARRARRGARWPWPST